MNMKSLLVAAMLAVATLSAQAATFYRSAEFVQVNFEPPEFGLNGFGRVTDSPSADLKFNSFAAPGREPFHDVWQFGIGDIGPGVYQFSTVIHAIGDLEFNFVFLSSVSAGDILNVDFSVSADGKTATGFGSFTVEKPCGLNVCVWLDLLGTQPINAKHAGYGAEFRATPVPEPQTYALMLLGLAALVGVARRQRAPAL